MQWNQEYSCSSSNTFTKYRIMRNWIKTRYVINKQFMQITINNISDACASHISSTFYPTTKHLNYSAVFSFNRFPITNIAGQIFHTVKLAVNENIRYTRENVSLLIPRIEAHCKDMWLKFIQICLMQRNSLQQNWKLYRYHPALVVINIHVSTTFDLGQRGKSSREVKIS